MNSSDVGLKGTGTVVWQVCRFCGKGRWVRTQSIKTPKYRNACFSCFNHHKNEFLPKGQHHGAWRGGRRTDKYGYVLVYVPDDSPFFPMVNRGKNHNQEIAEHRLVMAQKLGRCLESWEHVHHINANKSDNRIENLSLVTPSEHLVLTMMQMEIDSLKKRVTLLEAENVILRSDDGILR